MEPLATDQREYRETDVRNTIFRIDGCKRYEKAKLSAATEKAYFLERARKLRQAATILRDEQFSEELIAGVFEEAARLEQTAATYVVQRHKPPPSWAKEFAVTEALSLLTTFRNWRPGVTRGAIGRGSPQFCLGGGAPPLVLRICRRSAWKCAPRPTGIGQRCLVTAPWGSTVTGLN